MTKTRMKSMSRMKIPKIKINNRHISLGIILLETSVYALKVIKKLTSIK